MSKHSRNRRKVRAATWYDVIYLTTDQPKDRPRSSIRIPTKQNKRDTKLRDNMDIEDCSTRNKEINITRNVDVRYLSNLRTFADRIMFSTSCDQQQCPMIRERLNQHQHDHHTSTFVSWDNHQQKSLDAIAASLSQPKYNNTNDTHSKCNETQKIDLHTSIECDGQATRVSQSDKGTTHNFTMNNDISIIGKQTDETDPHLVPGTNKSQFEESSNLIDVSSNKTPMKPIQAVTANYYRKHESKYKKSDLFYDSQDDMSLKQTQDIKVISSKATCFKEHLLNDINEWVQDIPMYPLFRPSEKTRIQNIVNDFMEKLYNLIAQCDGIDNTHKIKREIGICLNRLPILYPGAKRDQVVFKDGLRADLLKKIQDWNDNINNNIDDQNYQQHKISIDIASNSVGLQKKLDESYFVDISKELVEKGINEWLVQVTLQHNYDKDQPINKKDITEEIMNCLFPLLNETRRERNYKLAMKSEIVRILHNLPICLNRPRYKSIYINRFAEELTNKLLSIQARHENVESRYHTHSKIHKASIHANQVTGLPIANTDLKFILHEGVNECLKHKKVYVKSDIKEEITDILVEYFKAIRSGDNQVVSAKVYSILVNNSENISEPQATNITKHIVESVRCITNQDKVNSMEIFTRNVIKPCLSDTIAVYTSEKIVCPSSCPVTSTPKKAVAKKFISKLNSEEIDYMENLGKLIKAWIETLPEKFDAPEDKDFKETIIKDLAGDLMDEAKLEQLAPGTRKDKEKYIAYIIKRWLFRLEVFDIEELDPEVQQLIERLKDISVPTLTKPQHGGRQAMDNIKHMEGERGWKEDFVPKGLDILEDEISIWMNEQPSSIYVNNDRSIRNDMVHELAEILQERLTNERSEADIANDVKQWLNKVIKNEEKHNIVDLTHALKERVVNLPQDATLAANLQKKLKFKAEYLEAKANSCCKLKTSIKTVNDPQNSTDPDKTMKEFIAKFIQHNYDIDDSMARGAFSYLLKTELQRLTPITRKDIYNKLSKLESYEKFSSERLEKELKYIKDISDWLKNIPINAAYNRVGNRERVDFVNDLARNIYDVEEQRLRAPGAMDYNMYLASIMSQFTEQLPILPEHKCNIIYMIDQLIGKVIVHRKPQPHCQVKQKKMYVNSTGIQYQNLSDFIDEYIRINGKEIAHDEIKLEAWSARLMKEIRKMVRDTADPSKLCKAQIYSKFANISLPADESVKRFGLELECVKEISEWLKNLPLLPISSQQAQETRIIMISDLAEKMAETESRKAADPSDTQADREFSDYVTRWISELPLDTKREIVLPLVIQQLNNRMKKLNKKRESNISQIIENYNRTKESPKGKPNSQSLKTNKLSRNGPSPEGVIVDAIEKWCNSLPVQGNTEKDIKIAKDNIAIKLFQKLCTLNDDPSICNDHILYQDLLKDEIDLQLDTLPQNTEMQNKRENLKSGLLQTILNARKIIQEKSAGDNYKLKLERTIEMSIPNPINRKQEYNPGFEIYKNRLATMFILENFDHGIDAVKMKYEKRVREEIDKYFQHAQNKNAIPLSKDQIYNELYSALFKVPVPDEHSVIEEVEEVKTRCEIDAWFEDLPLREAGGVGELLEWDKILSTLAKRIHEIEKTQSKPNEKIHKEITKWLLKLPLQPGNEGNIDNFVEKLENILQSTAEARKCTITKSGKGEKDKVKKTKSLLKTSQIADSSNKRKMSACQPAYQQYSCGQGSPVPQKKSADIILEIVEEWCNLLPLYANTSQEEFHIKILKEDLITKIVIKVSELNFDPEIFCDDLLYDQLLDEELEKIMSSLPTCCEFQQSQAARKMQLKDAINSVKPLIREEKSRYEYKQELKSTVDAVLKEPHNSTAKKETLFNNLKDDIVDNFVQYNYNRDDYEERQVYKMKVHEAVVKFVTDIVDKRKNGAPVDPFIRRNQLLCELAKIPIPSDTALKYEVEEIKMKHEVAEFFDKLSLPKADETNMKLRNQVKVSLAKRLNDIEKAGHNCVNESKMKNEIKRFLKKLDKEVNPELIDAFINKLKDSESLRKTTPLRKPGYIEISQSPIVRNLPLTYTSNDHSSSPESPRRHYARVDAVASELPSQSAGRLQSFVGSVPVNVQIPEPVHVSAGSGGQWLSLLPGTPPIHESGFHNPIVIRQFRPSLGEVWSPYSRGGDRSIDQSAVDSQEFAGGIALSSSANSRLIPIKSINQESSKRKSISRCPYTTSRGQSNMANAQQTSIRYTAQSHQAPISPQFQFPTSNEAMPNSAHKESTYKASPEIVIGNQVGLNIFPQALNSNITNSHEQNVQDSYGNQSPHAIPSSDITPQSIIRRPMAAPERVLRSSLKVNYEGSDDEDRSCKCRRRKRECKRRNVCYFSKRYCGSCSPFLYRMPCPGFIFY